jgi:hypothetical protein
MIRAAVLASVSALAFFSPHACPEPADPMGARCGQEDPTVSMTTYEACLELFGYTAT